MTTETIAASAVGTGPGARFSLGIDLGTTHCALSWVDRAASDGERVVQGVLDIPQLTAPASVEARPLLPSFLYLPHESELAAADMALPWGAGPHGPVGEFARTRGAATPIRLVSSAKSWLCHPGVDRRAPLLPADAPPEVQRVSPLAASTQYLQHLRHAWDHAHPEAPFDAQDVTVTIPASFDPAARELTAEACRAAGFQRLTLLEEPQAALYSWIQASAGGWRKQVAHGDVILVVDVGGGTTDLSLIAVLERGGNLELQRVAVGEHILLGGDNMDLALAYGVARKLAQEGKQLDAWQTRALAHGCRAAKEQLLQDEGLQSVPVVVPSRDSRLIGGSIRTEVTRAEVLQLLVEGFFPRVAVSDRPQARARAALTQLGLPYAQDAAVTRHLAAFLSRQAGATGQIEGLQGTQAQGASFLHPTAILFNGGVLKAAQIEQRILEVVGGWLAAEGAPPARLLAGANLDLAVARGAAYYGHVAAAGRGVRIRGGTAQSYYVGVESNMPAVPGMEPPISALCLAPFGMEEGTEVALDAQEFGLVVGEPVRLRFFGSSVRRSDTVGTLLDFWGPEELVELQEIEAHLPAEGRTPGEVVPVTLHARVTDIGTLELNAVPVGGSERWKVEFDVRADTPAA
ncbi:heat-shock protein [Alicycliphilus denitrificans]|uniref:Hsp70 family protein n=1 Tax=Alicycliphilus denitrificans TaxID=179636 RepID=UPI00095D8140|nr:Hsp70 family protein [Alicycliphilus denitrificans]MBN9572714.1 Hsp70 family protein [Alicycliphilus denitrificans]OJW92584.1 MAG: molecular chaperone DnaK [Alicycliphilus sp. 69-12]BCN37301.1 heat-shock protein [Alicycliphilus denitrificans]